MFQIKNLISSVLKFIITHKGTINDHVSTEFVKIFYVKYTLDNDNELLPSYFFFVSLYKCTYIILSFLTLNMFQTLKL